MPSDQGENAVVVLAVERVSEFHDFPGVLGHYGEGFNIVCCHQKEPLYPVFFDLEGPHEPFLGVDFEFLVGLLVSLMKSVNGIMAIFLWLVEG